MTRYSEERILNLGSLLATEEVINIGRIPDLEGDESEEEYWMMFKLITASVLGGRLHTLLYLLLLQQKNSIF